METKWCIKMTGDLAEFIKRSMKTLGIQKYSL